MELNLTSLQRLSKTELSTLFETQPATLILPTHKGVFRKEEILPSNLLPSSTPIAPKPLPLAIDKLPDDYSKVNQSILKEQKKQTKIFQEGLTLELEAPSADPAKDLKEKIKTDTEKSNLLHLEKELKEHQTIVTDTSTKSLTTTFEDVGKDIVKAIRYSGGMGGGGGAADIIDDATDLLPDGTRKPGVKKPGLIRRGLSKAARPFKAVGGKVAKPFKAIGSAALGLGSLVPATLTKAGGKVLKPVATLGSKAIQPVARLGGYAAKVGGMGMGALGTGGAATAATAGAGILAAGTAGALIGTGIQKLGTKLVGREDWVSGWATDMLKEREKKKAQSAEYTKWTKIASPAVLNMMGGIDNFDVAKFPSLRFKGLVKADDGKWYTKGEYDLFQVEEINSTVKRLEGETTGFPVEQLDLMDNITPESTRRLKAVLEEKEKLLETYDLGKIDIGVDEGSKLQTERIMRSYDLMRKKLDTATGRDKDLLQERMEHEQELLKDLTGKSYEQLQSLYKTKVAQRAEAQAADIPVPEVLSPDTQEVLSPDTQEVPKKSKKSKRPITVTITSVERETNTLGRGSNMLGPNVTSPNIPVPEVLSPNIPVPEVLSPDTQEAPKRSIRRRRSKRPTTVTITNVERETNTLGRGSNMLGGADRQNRDSKKAMETLQSSSLAGLKLPPTHQRVTTIKPLPAKGTPSTKVLESARDSYKPPAPAPAPGKEKPIIVNVPPSPDRPKSHTQLSIEDPKVEMMRAFL